MKSRDSDAQSARQSLASKSAAAAPMRWYLLYSLCGNPLFTVGKEIAWLFRR